MRNAANTWGAAPELIRLASSPIETSRTEWDQFSIPQWPRRHPSNVEGPAHPAGTLGIA